MHMTSIKHPASCQMFYGLKPDATSAGSDTFSRSHHVTAITQNRRKYEATFRTGGMSGDYILRLVIVSLKIDKC